MKTLLFKNWLLSSAVEQRFYTAKVVGSIPTGVTINKIMNKSSKLQLISALASRQWIVGSISEAGVSFSEFPAIHDSELSAKTEAGRLANIYPNKYFVWVRFSGGAVKGGLQYV